mgnify:CR=1 FL=1
MKTIRVGSRESRLAVVQSELVMDAIRAAGYDLTTPVVVTNSDELEVTTLAQGDIEAGTELLKWE